LLNNTIISSNPVSSNIMPILQFAPWNSQVEPAFWHALSQLKIDILRLSSDSVPVTAFYSASKSFYDRNSASDVALPSPLTLAGDACTSDFTPPPRSYRIHGTLKNFNTIDEFKTANKAVLFNNLADQVRTDRVSVPRPCLMSSDLVHR
jgi:ubiquitin-like modifier-activating enzyme ATG7